MPPPRLLEGIKVVDMTSIVFGPYCTQLLADMGADVVKVESPDGDPMRRSGYARSPGMGAAHMTLNRGKRSVVIDLKTPAGKAQMCALLRQSDVFIHNVRAKAIAKLGFAYSAVQELNPHVIYAHCVGFGSGGRYSERPAYDDVIQAASGLTSLPGRVDGNPAPRYMPSTIVDKVAGLHAAYAILAGYIDRIRHGNGQFIEIPMFECFTHFLLEEHLAGATFIPPLGPMGYRRQLEPNRQPFQTSDGWISIVPYGDANWLAFFEVAGHPEEISLDPLLASPDLRVENADILYAKLAKLTPGRTTADWLELMERASIPAMAHRDIDDLFDDPHLQDVSFFRERHHETEGAYTEMTPPVHFSGRPHIPSLTPARLGQHTEEVLAEVGYDPHKSA